MADKKDIFDEVNDKGADDHWRNPPRNETPMFSKHRDVGDQDIEKGKLKDWENR